MVAAEVLIAARESPWLGETGDEAAGKAFRFMGMQDGGADAVELLGRTCGDSHLPQLALGSPPLRNEPGFDFVEVGEHAGACLLSSLRGFRPKSDRDDELTPGGLPVQLAA